MQSEELVDDVIIEDDVSFDMDSDSFSVDLGDTIPFDLNDYSNDLGQLVSLIEEQNEILQYHFLTDYIFSVVIYSLMFGVLIYRIIKDPVDLFTLRK